LGVYAGRNRAYFFGHLLRGVYFYGFAQCRGAKKKKAKSAMQRMLADEDDFEDNVDGEGAMVEMVSNALDDAEEETEHGRHDDSDYDSEELASEDGSEEQASGDEGEYDEEAGDVPAPPLWDHDHDSASESSENGEFGEESEEEEDENGGGEDNAPAAMAVEAQGWLENEEDEDDANLRYGQNVGRATLKNYTCRCATKSPTAS
jgi:hypothetical protein